MVNPIVNVTVNIVAAPLPNNLQQMGAIISQGGTDLAPGESEVLTTLSDLSEIAPTPKALTSLAWASGVVTATTTAPHNLTNGDHISMIIAGSLPVGYRGTYVATVTGASTFTYPQAVNPGTTPASTPGTYVPADSAELVNQVTTFFNQGANQAVYVLELGVGTPAEGITALTAYLTANPGSFYRYLLPRAWSDEASLLPLVSGYETTTSKTYFHVTVTEDNYTDFTSQMKSVVAFIDSPDADPLTEYGAAWPFWVLLQYRPSPTNRVTPFAFAFGFGITPWKIRDNGAKFTAFKAAHINWAGTGSEGGISDTILFWGTTMDGRDGLFWYAVDWAQINIDLDISNAVINGSNSQPPLDYDQPGINRLEGVAAGTLSRGVSFGLLTGTVKQYELTAAVWDVNLANGLYNGQSAINAVPFPDYVRANPSDRAAGIYNGFAAVITTQRGFITIGFTINVTDFAA